MRGLNEYWKLQPHSRTLEGSRQELRRQGYRVSNTTETYKLDRLERRLERDLICYDKYTDEELRSFIKARHVPTKARVRHLMIIKLMDADDKQTFTRFMELPPELRVMVYEWYFASLPEVLRLPITPPIGLANCQLQREVVPLFYRSKRVYFDFIWYRSNYDVDPPQPLFKPDRLTQLFFSNTKPQHLAQVYHIELEPTVPWKIEIDIDVEGSGYNICVVEEIDDGETKRYITTAPSSETAGDQALVTWVRDIAARPAGQKMKAEDVWTLRKALENTSWLAD